MFSLVDHYRRLANEAGERAQQATDPSLKSTFAELAKGYVRLELAEQVRRRPDGRNNMNRAPARHLSNKLGECCTPAGH
jgi:hypothetical protein